MALAVGVLLTVGGALGPSDAEAARGGSKHHGGRTAGRAEMVRVYGPTQKPGQRGAARQVFIQKPGSSFGFGYPGFASRAAKASRYAATHRYGSAARYAVLPRYEPVPAVSSYTGGSYAGSYTAYGERGMSCVPFARENSGIEVSGNAGTWWNNAAGTYERGSRPEVGSVLNFRSTGRMRMGHVAVVTRVMGGRTIEIDHANWSGRGRISRGVLVADVSPGNDWTAVRVSLGRGADFGSVYPTFGFIYDRPDSGMMVANNGAAPGVSGLVRQVALRTAVPAAEPVEVAEAPDELPAPRAGRAVSRRKPVSIRRHVRHHR